MGILKAAPALVGMRSPRARSRSSLDDERHRWAVIVTRYFIPVHRARPYVAAPRPPANEFGFVTDKRTLQSKASSHTWTMR
jgi:hypothetical protein